MIREVLQGRREAKGEVSIRTKASEAEEVEAAAGTARRTQEKSPGRSQTAATCVRSMAGGAVATSASADKAAGAGRPKPRLGPTQTGLLAWPAERTRLLPRRGRGGSSCWWPRPQHERGDWGCGKVRHGRRRHERPRGAEGGWPRGHGRRRD